MTAADRLLDRAADRLEQLAQRGASGNGLAAKLVAPLGEDAEFLRKLKPSLIAARAKGQAPAPTNQQPAREPLAPTSPQLGTRPKPKKRRRKGRGPNPLLVAGAALAVGIVLAKVIDWRGHAHPRD